MKWIIIWISILKTWGVLYRRKPSNLVNWGFPNHVWPWSPSYLHTISQDCAMECSLGDIPWLLIGPCWGPIAFPLCPDQQRGHLPKLYHWASAYFLGSLFLPLPHRRNEAIESIAHGAYSGTTYHDDCEQHQVFGSFLLFLTNNISAVAPGGSL